MKEHLDALTPQPF